MRKVKTNYVGWILFLVVVNVIVQPLISDEYCLVVINPLRVIFIIGPFIMFFLYEGRKYQNAWLDGLGECVEKINKINKTHNEIEAKLGEFND